MNGTIRDPSADRDAATASEVPGCRHRIGGIEVEEASGSAFAEASGRAPLGDTGNGRRAEAEWWAMALTAVSLLAAGVGLIAWRMRRRPSSAPHAAAPVAFSPKVGPVDSFDKTRDAGPENMRDAATKWDEVDEGSDESFPASDPASYAPPGRTEPLRTDATNPGDEALPGTPGTGETLCPICHGSGRLDDRDCPNCGGSGKITQGIGGA